MEKTVEILGWVKVFEFVEGIFGHSTTGIVIPFHNVDSNVLLQFNIPNFMLLVFDAKVLINKNDEKKHLVSCGEIN